MCPIEFIPEDRTVVPLAGCNLVEASAGTGKTYSIAILTLRLIVEENMPIDKILMVTFTNAAVAELEQRIRKFVRLALKRAQGDTLPAADIGVSDLVDKFIVEVGASETLARLDLAKKNLDTTSIYTIHSFCQRTLTEFAFETGFSYGTDVTLSIMDYVEDFVNDYWREEISTIDVLDLSILKKFTPNGSNVILDKGRMVSSALNYLGGKTFFGTPIDLTNDLRTDYNAIVDLVNDIDYDSLYERAVEYSKWPRITDPRKEKLRAWVNKKEDVDQFIIEIKKSNTAEVAYFFGDIKDGVTDLGNNIGGIITGFYTKVAEYVMDRIPDKLQEEKIIHSDQLISQLEQAVSDAGNEVENGAENIGILQLLREKYQAVFVDEFQDTDAQQYSIFKNVFENKAIVFYIGDPKQSIYSFRKADINTYFNAKNNVNTVVYNMNKNFRSSANFVDSANLFFKPNEEVDTFLLRSDQFTTNELEHINVNGVHEACQLTADEQLIAPICIYQDFEKNEKIADAVANKALWLLSKGILSAKERCVKASDIAVLVRKGKEAEIIKKSLEKKNIPCIIIADSKIFKSNEATNVGYILDAVVSPTRKAINKALLGPITGYTVQKIGQLDDEAELFRFREYSKIWNENGIYAMMIQYAEDHRITSYLTSPEIGGGERRLSNFYQLAESLLEIELQNNYSKVDLIRFLKRNIAEDHTEEDRYIQRIESDEDAVKILTIHKSKGLEYNIVFAPFLDLKVTSHFFSDFRTPQNNYHFTCHGLLSGNEKLYWRNGVKQEDRRLLYVAITRAKYNCFIYKLRGNAVTSLTEFNAALMEKPETPGIFIGEYIYKENLENFRTENSNRQRHYVPVPNLTIPDRNWRKMSYSYLAGDHAYVKKELSNPVYPLGSYDEFVFQTLPKGAHVGNLLHNMFEFIDFTEQDQTVFELAVERSLQLFLPKYRGEFKEQLVNMLHTVLGAEISIGSENLRLNEIVRKNMVPELEFDFLTSEFNIGEINRVRDYIPENFKIHTRYNEEITGILTGFIDLFFEHNGKYYVLDWKSNFLGDELERYTNEGLADAMSDSNYHLQYLVYTVAIKKYLSGRVVDFDYDRDFGGCIYLFLRGVRSNGENGVFSYKPSLEAVTQLEKVFEGTVVE
ncbi:MAG: UvrD-helicase domain-containing protein [Flavobacteriales bacterium]|nr:UvrD-helicase domain-containing protein [Flavobacteriales bacterium]